MTTKFRTVDSKFKSKRRITMAQSGVIVRRNADQMIPNEFLELALKNNPHGWGAAVVTEEDGKKMLQLSSDIDPTDLQMVQEAMQTFMSSPITFYFCQSDTALSLADLSPHVLIGTDEDGAMVPQVVAFIEGNFPGSAQTGSSHPPEYHLVNDILVPKFEGLFELVDGDIDKLVEQLKKPHFKKELELHAVSRGYITIVTSTGESLTFQQPDGLSSEFPWGWASNSYGYGKAAAPAKKPGLFKLNRSTVREPAPAAAIAAAVSPPATSTSTAASLKGLGITVKREQPPTGLSRKDSKSWYQVRIGYKPRGHQDRIAVDVFYQNGKLMTYSQVKQHGLKAPAILALANNPEPEKDTQPETVQSNQTLPVTTEKAVTAEVLPIMPPVVREYINKLRTEDRVKKIISENAEVISDPKNIEGLETKFPDFAKQLGLKSMKEFACWDYPMMLETARAKPEGIANMCWTFRNICLKNGWLDQEAAKEAAPVAEKPKKPGLFKRSAAA